MSPCMTAILLSCSGLFVSMILILRDAIFSRSLCMSTFSFPKVSIAIAILSFVIAAGPQRACTDGIPFGAFAMTPAQLMISCCDIHVSSSSRTALSTVIIGSITWCAGCSSVPVGSNHLFLKSLECAPSQ